MEIRKIENRDFVMLPRLQHPGLKPKHVERDAFKAELKHVEGHGDYNPEELTPKYPDFIKERVMALYDAVYWWYEYGT